MSNNLPHYRLSSGLCNLNEGDAIVTRNGSGDIVHGIVDVWGDGYWIIPEGGYDFDSNQRVASVLADNDRRWRNTNYAQLWKAVSDE